MKTESFFQWYDRLGRPTLRYLGILILAIIGLSIAGAFVQWGFFGVEMKPLPGEALLMAMIPQVPQVADQITRSIERLKQISYAQYPQRGMAV